MISSQAREILAGVEAVIVDEIHAVAPSKRGSHLALTLERLDDLVGHGDADPADRAVGDPAAAGAYRPLPRRRGAGVRDRGCLGAKAIGPRDRGSRRGHGRARSPQRLPERRRPGPIEASLDPATTRSIWPAIYPELLRPGPGAQLDDRLRQQPASAERIAKRLNEMHNDELEAELPATEHAGNSRTGRKRPPKSLRAHHGSLSHEERALVEELLKSGELPCLVATSSLELGIDMGAVDLVIQVESPKSVTRGLQRVGRAGHTLGEVSKGRIFPKFRADLLECAVVARRMRPGEIEETVIPQNPLDVLAQHLVSMAALDEWKIDEVEKLVRSPQPFPELSREQLENVLDMLDGRYPSERFAELRPRIVWDRTKGTMRGRPGRPPAGRGQRRHDPRSRALRSPSARRAACWRARRGDGL